MELAWVMHAGDVIFNLLINVNIHLKPKVRLVYRTSLAGKAGKFLIYIFQGRAAHRYTNQEYFGVVLLCKIQFFPKHQTRFFHLMEYDLMCYSKYIFSCILCVFSLKTRSLSQNKSLCLSLFFPVIVEQIIISSIMDVGLKNSREFTFTSFAEGRDSLLKIQL